MSYQKLYKVLFSEELNPFDFFQSKHTTTTSQSQLEVAILFDSEQIIATSNGVQTPDEDEQEFSATNLF